MFKSFKYATHLSYVQGYYRVIIIDSLFEEELPLEGAPFEDWDYNFVYAAYAFDFYKKKKMNAVRNYCGFLRQIYGEAITKNIIDRHIRAIYTIFPQYHHNKHINSCLLRELLGSNV